MDPRISIITLGVSNLSRSLAFYRDGLGLPVSKHSSGGIAFFELHGTWLALFPKDELAADANAMAGDTGFSGITLAHNVRSKEEVDQLLEQAKAAGATIAKPAQDTDWGGYSGYFKDPDGYYWEVAFNPHFWVE